MIRYALLLYIAFSLSSVQAYVVQAECWTEDVGENDAAYELVEFYVVCSDEPDHAQSGYSPVYSFGDLKYRDYIRIDRSGRYFRSGISVSNENFSEITSKEHEGYLHITSNDESESILGFYKDELYPFLECMAEFSCIDGILNGIGFFDRYFNRDFIEMKKDYEKYASDSGFYEALKGVSLKGDEQLSMVMYFKNNSWKFTFDFSKNNPELIEFGKITE